MKRLSDCFEDLTADGIFRHITEAPWYTMANAMDLDMEYLWNHSGQKIPSPLVRKLLGDDGYLNQSSQESLARILWVKYGKKWTGLWETLTEFAVTPYQQGSYTDTTTSDLSRKITYGKGESESGSETLVKSGTEKETETPNNWKTERSLSGGWTDTDTTATTRTGTQKVTDRGKRENSVYGFNSVSAVGASVTGPQDALSGTSQEMTFGESGLKDANSGSVKRVYDTYKDSSVSTGFREVETSFTNREDNTSKSRTLTTSGTDTHLDTGTVTKMRTGNSASIGQILLELLDSYNGKDFFETVYSDIDEVLTLRVWI